MIDEVKKATFAAFSGPGTRLDGKSGSSKNTQATSSQMVQPHITNTSINGQSEIYPDEDYRPGFLKFIRSDYKSLSTTNRLKRESETDDDKSKPFVGKGQSIKGSKLRN
jgi:hypothetical protein